MSVSITIPKRALAEMFSHALTTDPEECCGVLIGSDDSVDLVRRVKNEHPEPIRRYQMSPLDLMRAEEDADAKGQRILAIYHSHTHTQAYPSQTDVGNAVDSGWTDPFYVLVSLVEKTRPVARAFRISDSGDISEIPIVTDGAAYQELRG